MSEWITANKAVTLIRGVITMLENAEADAEAAGDRAVCNGVNRYAAEAGVLLGRIDNAVRRLRSLVREEG